MTNRIALNAICALLLALLTLLKSGVHAQDSSASLDVKFDERRRTYIVNDNNVVRSQSSLALSTALTPLTAQNKEQGRDGARRFMQANSWRYGFRNLDSEFKEKGFSKDVLGLRRITLQQRHPVDGTEVFGANIKVGLLSDAAYASGSYLQGIQNLNTRPSIDERQAKLLALKSFPQFAAMSPAEKETLVSSLPPAKLYLYSDDFIMQGVNSKTGPGVFNLVYHVLVNLNIEINREFIIDAERGVVIRDADATLKDTDIPYDSVYDCSLGCSCRTNFPFQGYTWGRSGPSAPPRGTNPRYGGLDVDNAYVLMGALRNYYGFKFGRYGANNWGGFGDDISVPRLESRNYTYYNGCSASTCQYGNAWTSINPMSMAYCAGSLSNDVAAHEYFHGFIASERVLNDGVPASVLYTQGESGAINEALADFFGEAYEMQVDGGNQPNWITATNSNILEKRNLRSPSLSTGSSGVPTQYPKSHNSSTLYCGTADSGGVHRNSTVISYPLSLVAAPANQLQGVGTCRFYSIGMDKTLRLLYETMVRQNTTILNFPKFYDAVNVTCDQLSAQPEFGITATDCNNVTKAMQLAQIDHWPGYGRGGCTSTNARITYPYTVVSTCGARRGDTNMDGLVTSLDRDALIAQYGRTGRLLAADLNADKIVNAADLTILNSILSSTSSSSNSRSPV